ncbi:hypothetical protein DFH06DRAFT_1165824 [Mycena polygramma]|nr:hypothetical protein DFH06DRAFT_1165824 [Mycena polygramma]
MASSPLNSFDAQELEDKPESHDVPHDLPARRVRTDGVLAYSISPFAHTLTRSSNKDITSSQQHNHCHATCEHRAALDIQPVQHDAAADKSGALRVASFPNRGGLGGGSVAVCAWHEVRKSRKRRFALHMRARDRIQPRRRRRVYLTVCSTKLGLKLSHHPPARRMPSRLQNFRSTLTMGKRSGLANAPCAVDHLQGEFAIIDLLPYVVVSWPFCGARAPSPSTPLARIFGNLDCSRCGQVEVSGAWSQRFTLVLGVSALRRRVKYAYSHLYVSPALENQRPSRLSG